MSERVSMTNVNNKNNSFGKKIKNTSHNECAKKNKALNIKLDKIKNIFKGAENIADSMNLFNNTECFNPDFEQSDVNWDNIHQPKTANVKQNKSEAKNANVLYGSSLDNEKPAMTNKTPSADKITVNENDISTTEKASNSDKSAPTPLYDSTEQYKSEDERINRRREIDEASGGRVIYYHQSEG